MVTLGHEEDEDDRERDDESAAKHHWDLQVVQGVRGRDQAKGEPAPGAHEQVDRTRGQAKAVCEQSNDVLLDKVGCGGGEGAANVSSARVAEVG